jgi:hypothetical protein
MVQSRRMVLTKVRGLFRPKPIGEASGPGVATRRLCIVRRDRHLSGQFVASFTTALGLREEFEIIVDRRRGSPPANPPLVDRRCRPDVARALEQNGFAIVAGPEQPDHPKLLHAPAPSPIERLGREEADERQLERILGFERPRRVRLRLRQGLIPTGLIGVLLALLMLSPMGKSFVSRTRPAESPPADEVNASAIAEPTLQASEAHKPRPGPAIAETPSPNLEVHALEPARRAQSPETERSGDADTMDPSIPGPSVQTPAAAAPAPSAVDPPPTEVGSRDRFRHVGLPQADVTRNAAPASEGGGEAYAVRLSDSGGRPLSGAEVLLLIRMADGRSLAVPLGAGHDPGSYSVTIPTLQSAPVDLRLHVVTNNTRVEIPVQP